jgi:hypothetical protein
MDMDDVTLPLSEIARRLGLLLQPKKKEAGCSGPFGIAEGGPP